MSDEILMDNEAIRIQCKDGTFFAAAATFVKHARGDCTFVITAASADAMDKLVSNRADIDQLARTYGEIGKRKKLDYIERKPDGTCHRIHRENLGPGPGTHGEPEHAKPVETRVSGTVLQKKLGEARMPEAHAVTLPAITEKERTEARKQAAKEQQQKVIKPRM